LDWGAAKNGGLSEPTLPDKLLAEPARKATEAATNASKGDLMPKHDNDPKDIALGKPDEASHHLP
jgi:hypothetical protein